MAAQTLHIDAIISDAGIRDGQPIIAGTRIRVLDIAASHVYRGFTADELAVQFRLSLAHVYAALAFYYTHKDDLDAVMRRESETAEQLLQEFESHGKLIRVE